MLDHPASSPRAVEACHSPAGPSCVTIGAPGMRVQGPRALADGGSGGKAEPAPRPGPEAQPRDTAVWLADAERELRKVPFFVRGKARRNTEAYAAERGVAEIGLETLYEAKAHYAR